MPALSASHSSDPSYQDVFLDAFLALAAKARESTDVAYVTATREKLAVIGQAIDLKSPHVWERLAAATLGPGRKMEDLPPLSQEDQAWRQALAEAITIDLPAARGMSPEDFAQDGFYSHLGFSVLALFLPARPDDSALILRARDLMLKDRPLTYEGWMTWDIYLRWRDGQDEERQGQSPFLYLYDQLHYTTTYLIPEGHWATMGDRKLFQLFHSLWATGGLKEKSKMYELARWKVYDKAPVPPALKERRQAQLTQFASHCLGQPADQWSGWSVVKENWNGLSAEKKSEVIGLFLSMMGERLDVPMVPRFEIVKESFDKKDGTQFSDGCYRAWDVKADASGKEYAKWTNTISFLDSEDQRERPSYLNISARCMAFSAVHELLHADHEQMISRAFSSAPSRADYFLQVGGVEAVDKIGSDHPLYPASSILAGNTYGLDRSQYVRIDESEEMYRAQPTEKYVYAFDFN